MRKRLSLVTVVAMALITLANQSCIAQSLARYVIPESERDLTTQITRIRDLSGIPQDAALLYQQESQARDRADWYTQKGEQLMPGDQDAKARGLHDDVSALKQDSPKCSPSSLVGLSRKAMQISNSLENMKNVDVSPFSNDRFLPNSDDDEGAGIPTKCSDFSAVYLESLDKRIDEALKQHQSAVTKQKEEVGQLAVEYQNRYQALKSRLDQRSPEAWQRLLASAVILIVCIFAFGIFWLVKYFEPSLAAELINSGQLIQFPTVMILLVVIVVLGLSTILEEKTLGTLLGGIGGYVLSQGVGNSTARRVQREMTAANAQLNQSSIPPPV